MQRFKRKKVLVPLIVVAMLAISGAAIGFWTSNGSGNGTATVGTSAALTVTPVTFTGLLYPGGTAATSSITIGNPGNAPVKVSNLVLDTSLPAAGNQALSGIGGLPAAGCPAADFSFTSGIPAAGVSVPAGGNVVVTTGTLSMANTALNQDACKGLALTVYLKTA